MKYFPVVLFIVQCLVVLAHEAMDKILMIDCLKNICTCYHHPLCHLDQVCLLVRSTISDCASAGDEQRKGRQQTTLGLMEHFPLGHESTVQVQAVSVWKKISSYVIAIYEKTKEKTKENSTQKIRFTLSISICAVSISYDGQYNSFYVGCQWHAHV